MNDTTDPRPARPSDAAALRRLQSVLSEPSPQLLSAAIAERSTERIDTTEPTLSAVQTSTLLVSPDSDDRPVGYLLAVGSDSPHIAELVVDPDHRREHRATALLAAVCGSVTKPVTVHVAATNESARSLYREVGFVETNRSSERFETDEALTLRYDPKKKRQTSSNTACVDSGFDIELRRTELFGRQHACPDWLFDELAGRPSNDVVETALGGNIQLLLCEFAIEDECERCLAGFEGHSEFIGLDFGQQIERLREEPGGSRSLVDYRTNMASKRGRCLVGRGLLLRLSGGLDIRVRTVIGLLGIDSLRLDRTGRDHLDLSC
jgi:ribosomal-protein-alanine N-acetyltransferase